MPGTEEPQEQGRDHATNAPAEDRESGVTERERGGESGEYRGPDPELDDNAGQATDEDQGV
jgi:hypothetical protein